MAKKESELQLIGFYQSSASLFFSVRMFANAWARSPREEYLVAVAQMMQSYENEMKSLVQVECNKMQIEVRPGVENVAIHRFRQERYEAIANVVQHLKTYLIALNPPADEEKKP